MKKLSRKPRVAEIMGSVGIGAVIVGVCSAVIFNGDKPMMIMGAIAVIIGVIFLIIAIIDHRSHSVSNSKPTPCGSRASN
jgi:hypothetical protein